MYGGCRVITGHSYVVYGPLLNGATSFMFEGRDHRIPTPDRWWSPRPNTRITTLYTATSTAIRPDAFGMPG